MAPVPRQEIHDLALALVRHRAAQRVVELKEDAAADAARSERRARASGSTPWSGWVGSSSACSPCVSRICSRPKWRIRSPPCRRAASSPAAPATAPRAAAGDGDVVRRQDLPDAGTAPCDLLPEVGDPQGSYRCLWRSPATWRRGREAIEAAAARSLASGIASPAAHRRDRRRGAASAGGRGGWRRHGRSAVPRGWVWRGRPPVADHIEARLRARLQHAPVLQQPVGLKRRREADAVPSGHAAQGRGPRPDGQRPRLDHARHAERHRLVEMPASEPGRAPSAPSSSPPSSASRLP